MNLTPEHWRHARVIDSEIPGKFAVVSFYTRSRYGPMALAALGFDPKTATDGISRADALTLGEKLEKRLIENNGGEARRRRK